MVLVNSITISDLKLDIYKGPIGICASGGTDSSVLLYLLMKYSNDIIHIFTTGNKKTLFKNIRMVDNVIFKCFELTGNYNIEKHINYCDVQTNETILSRIYKYAYNNIITMFYTGITDTPPKHIMDSLFMKLPAEIEEVRNPLI